MWSAIVVLLRRAVMLAVLLGSQPTGGRRHGGAATPVQTGHDTLGIRMPACDLRQHAGATVTYHEVSTIRGRMCEFCFGIRRRTADSVSGGTPIHGWTFRRMRSSETNELHVFR